LEIFCQHKVAVVAAVTSGDGGDINRGAIIAGVVCGVIVLLLLIALIIIIILCRRRRRRKFSVLCVLLDS